MLTVGFQGDVEEVAGETAVHRKLDLVFRACEKGRSRTQQITSSTCLLGTVLFTGLWVSIKRPEARNTEMFFNKGSIEILAFQHTLM